MSSFTRGQVALFVVLSCAISLQGQVSGGTITGTVSDASGSVIPKAKVTVTNRDTGVSRTSLSNAQGFYTAPNLVPGRYQIEADATGFGPRGANITVTVGDDLKLDLSLEPSTVTQQVIVTDIPASVELSSSALSAQVNGPTIRDLPLNGRSWTDLATLQPGVAGVQTQVAFNQGAGRGNRGFGAQISISGGRPQQNNYRLDGISINDYANGGPGSVLGTNLGVDAIEEFSVITSNYSAEYGRTSGGVINAMTRSGTKQFHGNAYEFLRNSALDTRNYFDGSTIPPFKRNQFGASAGGPLWRDHTFIFGDYESIRQSLGLTNHVVTPSTLARTGVLYTPTGSLTKVVVDPTVQKYFALFPVPNTPIAAGSNSGTYIFTNEQVVNENYFTIRADHKIYKADSAFATYMYDDAPYTQSDAHNNVLQGNHTRRQALILEENHIFSSTFINSARFGLNRQAVENNQSVSAINPVAADMSLGVLPGQNAAGINVPGLDRMVGGVGSSPTYFFHFTTFQGYDDAFLTVGHHSMKFGIAFERLQNNMLALSNPSGLFNFANLSNFLTNVPTKFTAGIASSLTPRNLRQWLLGSYFQDDWRVQPYLTLNLGLRYEMSSVPTEINGKLSTLRQITDASPHLGDPFFYNPTLRNFEPRVGFAWDPFRDGQTSIRGGFGIYDVLPLLYQVELLAALSSPYFQAGATSNPNIKLGVPPDVVEQSLISGTPNQTYLDAHPKRNYVYQWNLSVQRQLAKDVTWTAAYVGSRGLHQPFRVEDANVVLPAVTAQGYFWPSPTGSGTQVNPHAGTIRALFWMADSSYNALETNATVKLGSQLQLYGAFTYGRSIDNNSATVAGDAFGNSVPSLDWFAPRLSFGPSDFNVGKIFVTNLIWKVPGTSAKDALSILTNGWQAGAIYKQTDGTPFTPLIGGDPLGKKSSDPWDYPDRVAGCPVVNSNYKQNGALNYVNLKCFTFPAPSTRRGNAGRNIIVGPGLSEVDLSLFKNNVIRKVSEDFNVQFRVELFNVLNHTNFNPPNNNNQQLYDATGTQLASGGVLSSPTATSSRQLQFGLKLIW
jgi:hypothetical protein